MQQPLQIWDSHTSSCKWNLQAASDTKCGIHTRRSQPCTVPGKPSAVPHILEERHCFPTKLLSPANPAGAPGKAPWLPTGFLTRRERLEGADGKDKHHPEVFATSLSLPSLLCRSFIFCCSSEVETQIAAGANKQIPSYSIINKVVPVSSRASLEICLNVFSPKLRAHRFHFPILWVKSWNCAQETQCQTFIRKLKNLDFFFANTSVLVQRKSLQCKISHRWELLHDKEDFLKDISTHSKEFYRLHGSASTPGSLMETIRNNLLSFQKTCCQLEKDPGSCHSLQGWHS